MATQSCLCEITWSEEERQSRSHPKCVLCNQTKHRVYTQPAGIYDTQVHIVDRHTWQQVSLTGLWACPPNTDTPWTRLHARNHTGHHLFASNSTTEDQWPRSAAPTAQKNNRLMTTAGLRLRSHGFTNQLQVGPHLTPILVKLWWETKKFHFLELPHTSSTSDDKNKTYTFQRPRLKCIRKPKSISR